jgi:hypothetical protein
MDDIKETMTKCLQDAKEMLTALGHGIFLSDVVSIANTLFGERRMIEAETRDRFDLPFYDMERDSTQASCGCNSCRWGENDID